MTSGTFLSNFEAFVMFSFFSFHSLCCVTLSKSSNHAIVHYRQ